MEKKKEKKKERKRKGKEKKTTRFVEIIQPPRNVAIAETDRFSEYPDLKSILKPKLELI